MWILAFLFSINAFAAHFDDPEWRALLHFEKSSAISSNKFFLHPNGNLDPKAEWEATLNEFRKNPESLCRFPARAIYFQNTFKFVEPKDAPLCVRWKKWKEAISAKGIELVFAAGFISSPSSMYGHTLLKFPRSGKTEGHELLDYTLSFGADTGGAGGFNYVWKGLTGGFDGFYTTAPFYLKVREYNFVENRDFWIYPLKLPPDALEKLVAHAWELREIPFPYFFFRKNCSYFLLEFLKVAYPQIPLLDEFSFWAIPMDTIRTLKKYSLVGEPRYRPSRYRTLTERRNELSAEERSEAKKIANTDQWNPPNNPKVLDAAYELVRYKQEGRVIDPTKENQILSVRGIFPPPTELIFNETPPDLGHGTSRFGVNVGKNSKHTFGEITYRAALHDLLASQLGYEPYSELTMGDLVFRWEEKFFLERFDILKLRSIPPLDSWIFRKSWSFRTGVKRFSSLNCKAWNCLGAYMAGGMGFSLPISSAVLFALLELDVEAGKAYVKNHALGVGPSAGLWIPLGHTKFIFETEKRFKLLGDKKIPWWKLGVSQSFSTFELRATWQQTAAYEEGALGLYHYF